MTASESEIEAAMLKVWDELRRAPPQDLMFVDSSGFQYFVKGLRPKWLSIYRPKDCLVWVK